jgi:hypothetical protein
MGALISVSSRTSDRAVSVFSAELPEEERAELARELVGTLPEDLELEDGESGFSEEWQAEIRRRFRDEPRGEPLTFEQLREHVEKVISHGE